MQIKASSYLDKLAFYLTQWWVLWSMLLISALWLLVCSVSVGAQTGQWTVSIVLVVAALLIVLTVVVLHRRVHGRPLPAATARLNRLMLPPLISGFVLLVIVAALTGMHFLARFWSWLPSDGLLIWASLAALTILLPSLVLPFLQDQILGNALRSQAKLRRKVAMIATRYRADAPIPFSQQRYASWDRYWIQQV